jgi:hypothetical protein
MITHTTGVPVYLSIAAKVQELRALETSDRAIARTMGVSDKTVAKAICFAASHQST